MDTRPTPLDAPVGWGYPGQRPMDQQDLNRMVPAVESGPMTPSTEKLALWPWTRLQGRLSGSARLERLEVLESDVPLAEVQR